MLLFKMKELLRLPRKKIFRTASNQTTNVLSFAKDSVEIKQLYYIRETDENDGNLNDGKKRYIVKGKLSPKVKERNILWIKGGNNYVINWLAL